MRGMIPIFELNFLRMCATKLIARHTIYSHYDPKEKFYVLIIWRVDLFLTMGVVRLKQSKFVR